MFILIINSFAAPILWFSFRVFSVIGICSSDRIYLLSWNQDLGSVSPTSRNFSGDLSSFVSSIRTRFKLWNLAVILPFLIYGTYAKRAAFQGKRIIDSRIAFRGPIDRGSLEKRYPDLQAKGVSSFTNRKLCLAKATQLWKDDRFGHALLSQFVRIAALY